MSIKHNLRALALGMALFAGAFMGVFTPEEIEKTMHSLNQQTISVIVSEEENNDDDVDDPLKTGCQRKFSLHAATLVEHLIKKNARSDCNVD